MRIYKEDACVGCAECTHCGLKFKHYTVYECDCGNETTDPEGEGWDLERGICNECIEEEEEEEED